MRWTFTIVLRNPSDVGIAFEQLEMATQAVGTVDSIWGGMAQPFAQRLEPGSELRIRPSQAWGCPSARRQTCAGSSPTGSSSITRCSGATTPAARSRFPSPSD